MTAVIDSRRESDPASTPRSPRSSPPPCRWPRDRWPRARRAVRRARHGRTRCPSRAAQTWTGAHPRQPHAPSRYAIDLNRTGDLGRPRRRGRRRASSPTADTTTHHGGYGRHVVIDHGNGETLASTPTCDSVIVARRGSTSTRAPCSARVGNTGNSLGAAPALRGEGRPRASSPRRSSGVPYRDGALTSLNCVDVPLAGDFTGDRVAEVAVFRRAHRSRRSSSTTRRARAVLVRQGVRRAAARRLGRRRRGSTSGSGARRTASQFTLTDPDRDRQDQVRRCAADRPIAGDWDGDGTDRGRRLPARRRHVPPAQRRRDVDRGPARRRRRPAGHRRLGRRRHDRPRRLRPGDRRPSRCAASTPPGLSVARVVQFGCAGDLPVDGDWNGDGITDLGVWTPATATFTQRLGRRAQRSARGVLTRRSGSARPAADARGREDRRASGRGRATEQVRRAVLRVGQREGPAARRPVGRRRPPCPAGSTGFLNATSTVTASGSRFSIAATRARLGPHAVRDLAREAQRPGGQRVEVDRVGVARHRGVRATEVGGQPPLDAAGRGVGRARGPARRPRRPADRGAGRSTSTPTRSRRRPSTVVTKSSRTPLACGRGAPTEVVTSSASPTPIGAVRGDRVLDVHHADRRRRGTPGRS